MNDRYRVELTPDERESVEALVRGGKGAVRRLERAQILLALDAGSTEETIARNVGVGTSTVYRTSNASSRRVGAGAQRVAPARVPRASSEQATHRC